MSTATPLTAASVALAVASLTMSGALAAEEPERRRALVIGIDGLTGPALHRYAFAEGANGARRARMDRGVFAPCESADDPSCARAHDGPAAGDEFRYETASGWVSTEFLCHNPKNAKTSISGASERCSSPCTCPPPSLTSSLTTGTGEILWPVAALPTRDGSAHRTWVPQHDRHGLLLIN